MIGACVFCHSVGLREGSTSTTGQGNTVFVPLEGVLVAAINRYRQGEGAASVNCQVRYRLLRDTNGNTGTVTSRLNNRTFGISNPDEVITVVTCTIVRDAVGGCISTYRCVYATRTLEPLVGIWSFATSYFNAVSISRTCCHIGSVSVRCV